MDDKAGLEGFSEGREVRNLHEQVFANSLLTIGAGKSSSALDTFSGWLLGGFGAALALLLSNLDSVSPYIPIAVVKNAAFVFILAAVLGVAEKYLAAIVSGAVEGFFLGTDLGERTAEREIELDLSVVFTETERAAFRPAKWIARRMLRKFRQGDLVASGRFFSRCSQVQGILVLCEAILVIFATCLIVGGLTELAS